MKNKMYNQNEVDCEVRGCKVKKKKWARHVDTETNRKGVQGEAVMEKLVGIGGKGWAELSTMLYHYYCPRREARMAAGEPVHLGQESFLDLQAAWQRESLLACSHAMPCIHRRR